MTALRIAVVGAPDTGKSRLIEALDIRLKASGMDALVAASSTGARQTPDLVFLMGLESSRAASVDADQTIRALLTREGTAHEVLYGSPDARFAQAMRSIEKKLAINGLTGIFQAMPSRSPRQWTWACDKCSDPQCEHRLLTDLLAERAAGQPTEP